MASSRWKRFAFFERHTQALPSEVLEDVIPVKDEVRRASGISSRALDAAPEATNDAVSLVVTTAALPLASKPRNRERSEPDASDASVSAMWSTLDACCVGPEMSHGNPAVRLPSQSQPSDQSIPEPSSTAVDGLVLVFVTSNVTDFVHCFDVTVRCNPPPPEVEPDREDLDGWRGYIAPFGRSGKAAAPSSSAGSTRAMEERIIAEHMDERKVDGIVAIAACRDTTGHRPVLLACITETQVVVWEDPHLHLSCRRPLTPSQTTHAKTYELISPWNQSKDGLARAIDIAPGVVAVGTSFGAVLVFIYGGAKQGLRPYLTIPPPPTSDMGAVCVKLSLGRDKASVFVAYHRVTSSMSSQRSTAGICCYDMPLPNPSSAPLSAPSARHDLDGRHVLSSSLCDGVMGRNGVHFTVARPDGLYTYSQTQKVAVAPIDGTKLAICIVPPPDRAGEFRELATGEAGSSYALVASTDSKSGRDAVDIYDATNKLVAFHLLLSPGHRAVCAAGVTTMPTRSFGGIARGGRSSAVVLTSGGSIVTLCEKVTSEKVSLLVQKNLYSAAIIVAYADPSYEAAKITALYRSFAEHLYRKGDYSGAMDQYIHTIGSLESSHIIFRYLDAPKIPLLVKYLEELRSRNLASAVHNELLRTCYLKLNDTESAEAIAASASRSMDTTSLSSVLSSLTHNPKEALATICTLEAPQAAEALVVHGASLARALPRETAGVVVSLCLGTYSPTALADAALAALVEANKMLEYGTDDRPRACEAYPVHLFASAFLENPKTLRLLLAHCNRNKCALTPSLRRTLLELTIAEWNQAKRSHDTEAEKLRRKEAIAALTDSHCRDIGDYDALVIVQLGGFQEGELLLYERLQMGPVLLARYASDGSEKARRQMLAMCQTDPEILADVLGYFVSIASEKLDEDGTGDSADDASEDESSEILIDIQEALTLARRQGVLPPVRVARILAGEGTGQFGTQLGNNAGAQSNKPQPRAVPLAVALDYVGAVLDESRKEIARLKSEVEEYNQLCNSMEAEVESLFRASLSLPPVPEEPSRLNVEEMYSKVRVSLEDIGRSTSRSEESREAFWREMNHAEESFETIARYFAKGVIQ